MDILINKPIKDEGFQSWYVAEVQKQRKEVSVEETNVDVTSAAIKTKTKTANWTISVWQALKERPEVVINGFKFMMQPVDLVPRFTLKIISKIQ